EALEWTDLPLGTPGPGEVLVRQTAVGVNFIDIYFRTGLYPWPGDTITPGGEAAGIVEAVGEGASLKPGDRVAYVSRNGAYREQRVMPEADLVSLPDGIDERLAASVMLKGLTVHYLVNSSYQVKPGDTVLVHAAAGGVGLLIGQWLNSMGARAIGTAGSAEKVALAKAHGYDAVINYRTEDFVEAVGTLTGGSGVAAVYDGVGRDTWEGSLKCLSRLGTLVSFGQSSGPLDGFTMAHLAGGSFTAVRPVLFDYIATRQALEARTGELFEMLQTGKVTAKVAHERPLTEAGDVHRALEGRSTTGSTVLLP
ncbi:MAG: quinone oxidoreductase, partial [Pseudomonadota bacterium]